MMKIIVNVESQSALSTAQDIEKLSGVKGIKLTYDTREKTILKRN